MTTQISAIEEIKVKNHANKFISKFLKSWEFLLLLITCCIFLLNTQISEYFLDPWNLSDATFNFVEKAIIALPFALLIIIREIDLSVASTIALSSVCMGLLAQLGYPIEVIVIAGILVGGLCGFINGFLVTYFEIPSIVVTIGTMSLFRGITYIILGDTVLNKYPSGFEFFGQGYVYWVFSFEFTLFLFLSLVFFIILHRTNIGRRIYFIGNNPKAAYYSGINVKRYQFWMFILVGLIAGLASVLLTSRLGSTRPSIALGWELNIVTMVVLGGVSILGGKGTITGVVIAAFLMGLLNFGLSLINVPGIVMSTILGVMLILIIAIPNLYSARKRR